MLRLNSNILIYFTISGLDNSDLASVNRILESANSRHFQSFLAHRQGNLANELMRSRLNMPRNTNQERNARENEDRPSSVKSESNDESSDMLPPRARTENGERPGTETREGQGDLSMIMDIGDLPKQVIYILNITVFNFKGRYSKSCKIFLII
jgi:hypothetical protein